MIDKAALTELTAEIVAAYVANNSVQSGDLGGLITTTFAALDTIAAGPAPAPEKPQPIVSIKKSITPDFLISLEDGKRYKSLKRHLSGRGLTPAEYREKWGLALDYPMVAPNYAKQRSELAKALGLGQKQKKSLTASPASKASKAPAKTARTPRKPKATASA